MVVERGPRLAPRTASDAERLDSYRVGSEVNVQFVRNGSRVMERKWWVLLGLVVERCNVPWKTKEQASEAVKLALGIVNLTKTIGGSWMQYPKSLTDLDDTELDEAVRDMMDLITKMTGIDPDTLRKEIADVGRDETEQPEAASPSPSSGSEASGADARPDDGSAGLDQSAGAADQEGGTDATADESPSDPALSEADQKKWLITFAAVMAAMMKQFSETDVVDASKSNFREGLSDPIRKKARSITNYARQVARKEIEFAKGLDVIAGVAGCETREIKP